LAKGKISAQTLKHDPLMEQYVKSSEWVKGRSRPLLTWVVVVAALVAGFLIVRAVMASQERKAGAALAEAFKIDNAVVADPLPPSTRGQIAFKTEAEKHKAAYEAFERAVSYYGDLARYYGAVHQLYFDAPKAEATLKAVADGNSVASSQARLALAEHYRVSGKFNEALAEYKKLKDKPGDVAPLMIDFGIAQTHEALGQTKEASDIFFNIAKDSTKTNIGTKALTHLTRIDPSRVDELPTEEKPGAGRSGSFVMPK